MEKIEEIQNDLDEHEQREYADLLDNVFQRAAQRVCDNSTEGRLDRCLLRYAGIGGVLFQAVKLIVGSHRAEHGKAVNNLLDAMGYAALACVELEHVESAKYCARRMTKGYDQALREVLNPERRDDIGA